MKKMKIALWATMLFAGVASAQTTDPTPYCTAGYDDAGGAFPWPHYISNVTLGTLSNSTGTTQFPGAHYAFYNTVAAPVLTAGSSYSLSIAHDSSSTIQFIAVYIDYNHNNSFMDAGERVLEQDPASITNPATAIITIPSAATSGITRMRVVLFEDDAYTWIGGATHATPCTSDSTGDLDWGETEDYNVNIISSSALAPVAGFKVNATAGTVSTVFNFTDTSSNSPTTRKWTFTPASVTYQSGTSNTSANPSVNLIVPGSYTVKLVVTNSSGKDSVTKAGYITVTNTNIVNSVGNDIASHVYPNPANNVLHIPAELVDGSLKICDMQGRQVLVLPIVKEQISVDHLPVGLYILRITKESKAATQLLTIER